MLMSLARGKVKSLERDDVKNLSLEAEQCGRKTKEVSKSKVHVNRGPEKGVRRMTTRVLFYTWSYDRTEVYRQSNKPRVKP